MANEKRNLKKNSTTTSQRADAMAAAAQDLEAANEKLQEQAEELAAQTEELRTANEELRSREQALVEAREHWERTFDSVPDLVAILDDRHRIVRANRAMAERLGLPSDQCIGLPCYKAVHGTDEPPAFCPHARTLRDGAEHLAEVREDRLGGDFMVSTTPIHDERGKMYGSVHVARDVTERKRAELKAREVQRRTVFANRVLRAFVEYDGNELFERALEIVQEEMASRQGVFGYIPEPGHLICPSLSRMLDECEIEGKCIHYPPEKWKGLWGRALTEKRSLYTNEAPPVPPGHPAIHNNLAAPIVFHDQTIGLLNLANKEGGYGEEDRQTLDHIAASIAPVLYAWIERKLREDERTRAEDALRESKERLQRAQEIAHLGSWELDLVSDELTWSDEVYRIFGLQPQQFGATYEGFLERVHSEDRAAVDAAYSDSVRQGRNSYEIEHRICRADTGEVRFVHEKCEHLRDEAGRVIRSMGMVQDITEQKRAEQKLERTNANLEEFAYVTSHDLQEPLRAMASYSQLLEKRYKDKLDQDAKDFIGFIVEAADRMQTLIADLLAYSRAGRKGLKMSRVNCNEVVRGVTEGLSQAIEDAGATVSYEDLPAVAGAEVAFTQVFQNLIGNALKFHGPQPPEIRIAATRGYNEWIFSVSDNGIGMEPKYAEKIFKVFQRLHSRSEYDGTGIGLSICRKIVENWGGRIWVESEPGRGSTFYFTVPK